MVAKVGAAAAAAREVVEARVEGLEVLHWDWIPAGMRGRGLHGRENFLRQTGRSSPHRRNGKSCLHEESLKGSGSHPGPTLIRKATQRARFLNCVLAEDSLADYDKN